MTPLVLHDHHQTLGARFIELQGQEAVGSYLDAAAEYAALQTSAGLLDFSFRSRLVLAGADRQRFLHGQVTNDVNGLRVGEGCYAALITAKGKMLSDLNVYLLEEEILLDFEPGLTQSVAERLEKYIIADDVQVVDVAPHYGMLAVRGPKAAQVAGSLCPEKDLPSKPLRFHLLKHETFGELYLINQAHNGTSGFGLFAPWTSFQELFSELTGAAERVGGRACGWEALEITRIEAGVPRFGIDLDETNLPPEAGLEARAISYTKGCYIGQEVISRIRTYGQVAKTLRGILLPSGLQRLPQRGDKLYFNSREVGYITSAAVSPALKANLALGYVRREANQIGNALILRVGEEESPVRIVELPFRAAG